MTEVHAPHPDDVAVDRFAAAMKAKLAKKRADGYGGWDNPEECTIEHLSRLLINHVGKGDPVDVGNLAMMIHQRSSSILISPTAAEPEKGGYHARVDAWMKMCFGEEVAADIKERPHRFLEEALELVQAVGTTKGEAETLVEYVFGRPSGETRQEIGGTVLTLAALCNTVGFDMLLAAEDELSRVSTPQMIAKLQAKNAAKDPNSPLPGFASPSPSPEIKATEIVMGRGLVDVTKISHEGRSGILFRARSEHIPVGADGQLQAGEYWPVAGDVIIWIENEGGASVIEKYLRTFLPSPPASAEIQALQKIIRDQKASLLDYSERNIRLNDQHDELQAEIEALRVENGELKAGMLAHRERDDDPEVELEAAAAAAFRQAQSVYRADHDHFPLKSNWQTTDESVRDGWRKIATAAMSRGKLNASKLNENDIANALTPFFEEGYTARDGARAVLRLLLRSRATLHQRGDGK